VAQTERGAFGAQLAGVGQDVVCQGDEAAGLGVQVGRGPVVQGDLAGRERRQVDGVAGLDGNHGGIGDGVGGLVGGGDLVCQVGQDAGGGEVCFGAGGAGGGLGERGQQEGVAFECNVAEFVGRAQAQAEVGELHVCLQAGGQLAGFVLAGGQERVGAVRLVEEALHRYERDVGIAGRALLRGEAQRAEAFSGDDAVNRQAHGESGVVAAAEEGFGGDGCRAREAQEDVIANKGGEVVGEGLVEPDDAARRGHGGRVGVGRAELPEAFVHAEHLDGGGGGV
jgi:hypothetical protein